MNNITSQNDLVHFLKTINKIDFIARCITPWHLIGVEAFANRLKNLLSRKVNGIVLITPHCKTGFSINISDYQNKEGINIIFFKINNEFFEDNNLCKGIHNLMTDFKIKDKLNRNLYIISPMKAWSSLTVDLLLDNCKYDITNIVIDDGVSSYESKSLTFLKYFDETSSLSDLIKNFIKIPYEYFLQYKYKYKVIKFGLFKSRKKGLSINKDVIISYKEILKVSDYNEKSFLKFQRDYVLILTQPFSNVELNNELFIQEMLKPLQARYNSQNIDVYIKPHPRDNNLELYNDFKILNYNGPIEQFINDCNKKPTKLIGIYSTSLITMKLFYDIDTISLAKSIKKYVIDKNLKKSITQFRENFSDYITIQ